MHRKFRRANWRKLTWESKTILHFLPASASAPTLIIGGKTITKDNIEEYREEYTRRLSIYSQEIKQRGYRTVSGRYKGKTSKSCRKINSAWVSVISEGIQTGMEITQDGFDAQLVLGVKLNGEEMSIENPAVIIELTITLLDEMNPDYLFQGEIINGVITLKPDLSVLKSWPRWANPPRKRDLKKCTITLEPLSGNSDEPDK